MWVELVSRLSVSFHKSRIIGFNVDQDFLKEASDFMACAITYVMFSFLGILIGCNPRRKASWDPVLCKLRNILASWKEKDVSLDGRVTMNNYVLNSFPLYSFSFYKDPKVVI